MQSKTSWERGVRHFKCNKCCAIIQNNPEFPMLIPKPEHYDIPDHVIYIGPNWKSIYCGKFMPMFEQPNQPTLQFGR